MDLFEYEGKKILEKYSIPVQKSVLICSPQEKIDLPYPVVLKAQVMTGGRGKAGGIKVCNTEKESQALKNEIFALNIKGHKVQAILAAERLELVRELYLSITLQGTGPLLIASGAGGIEIEEVAKVNPEKIIKMEIDPISGIKPYQIRYIAKQMAVNDTAGLSEIISNLYRAFRETNANLIEINPLAVTEKGLVAIDSKVTLDEKAAYRNKELFARILEERKLLVDCEPVESDGTTITFVPLDGDVGLISDGAGTGMLTLDMINDAGASVASFCELGGITNADVMYRAMKMTLANPKVKSLFIVLIGGFNRMDEMAEGISKYKSEFGIPVPVFTRMCGTMEEEGKEIMRREGLPVYSRLDETVRDAVSSLTEVR